MHGLSPHFKLGHLSKLDRGTDSLSDKPADQKEQYLDVLQACSDEKADPSKKRSFGLHQLHRDDSANASVGRRQDLSVQPVASQTIEEGSSEGSPNIKDRSITRGSTSSSSLSIRGSMRSYGEKMTTSIGHKLENMSHHASQLSSQISFGGTSSTSHSEERKTTDQQCYQLNLGTIQKVFTEVLTDYISVDIKKHSTLVEKLLSKTKLEGLSIGSEGRISYTMPKKYTEFLKLLTVLLGKSKIRKALREPLKEQLEPLGFSFIFDLKQRAFVATYDGVSIFKERHVKRNDQDKEEPVPQEVLHYELQRQTDDAKLLDEKLRKTLIQRFSTAGQQYEPLRRRVNLTKQVIYYQNKLNHGCPIECDYEIRKIRRQSEVDLMTTEALRLSTEEAEEIVKAMHQYIDISLTQLPSTVDAEEPEAVPLITYNTTEFDARQILQDAVLILKKPKSLRDMLLTLVFTSEYYAEKSHRWNVSLDLRQWLSLCDELDQIEDWKSMPQAPWFTNLLAELLRQALPPALKQLGPLKISTSARKEWKARLQHWGIERSDKHTRNLGSG